MWRVPKVITDVMEASAGGARPAEHRLGVAGLARERGGARPRRPGPRAAHGLQPASTPPAATLCPLAAPPRAPATPCAAAIPAAAPPHRSAPGGTPTHTNTRDTHLCPHTPPPTDTRPQTHTHTHTQTHTGTHTEVRRQTGTPGVAARRSADPHHERTHAQARLPRTHARRTGGTAPSEITTDCLAGPRPPTHRHGVGDR